MIYIISIEYVTNGERTNIGPPSGGGGRPGLPGPEPAGSCPGCQASIPGIKKCVHPFFLKFSEKMSASIINMMEKTGDKNFIEKLSNWNIRRTVATWKSGSDGVGY